MRYLPTNSVDGSSGRLTELSINAPAWDVVPHCCSQKHHAVHLCSVGPLSNFELRYAPSLLPVFVWACFCTVCSATALIQDFQ